MKIEFIVIKNILSILMLILMLTFTYAEDNTTFINQYEYGKELYKNPRGIGCIQCHGENGEGGVIAYVVQNGKRKEIIAPKIKGLTFVKFENALKYPKGLMPKYYLTIREILAIYSFLNPEIINEN